MYLTPNDLNGASSFYLAENDTPATESLSEGATECETAAELAYNLCLRHPSLGASSTSGSESTQYNLYEGSTQPSSPPPFAFAASKGSLNQVQAHRRLCNNLSSPSSPPPLSPPKSDATHGTEAYAMFGSRYQDSLHQADHVSKNGQMDTPPIRPAFSAHDVAELASPKAINVVSTSLRSSKKRKPRTREGECIAIDSDDDASDSYLPKRSYAKKAKTIKKGTPPIPVRSKVPRNNWHSLPMPISLGVDGRTTSSILPVRLLGSKPGTLQCGYIGPSGVRCQRQLKPASFERHDITHLYAEARSFLHHQETIDVLDMAQIMAAVLGEFVSPGSSIDWDFAKLLPFDPIPEDVENRLTETLQKTRWNLRNLSREDYKKLRKVAIYFSQWYAHRAYTCSCFESLGKEPRLWVRPDEFQAYDHHPELSLQPEVGHSILPGWRNDTPIVPYRQIVV